MNYKINKKGSYTALIGLMLLVLVATIAFTSIGKSESIKGKTIVKVAGDVKRTFERAQFLLDKTASAVIAKATIDAYNNSIPKTCSVLDDYMSAVQTRFSLALANLETDTGINCLVSNPESIFSATNFGVTLACSQSAYTANASADVRYFAQVDDTFTLNKTVTVDSSAGCTVTVKDTHSGLVDTTITAS
ncbi:MAG: hypothetical protein Q7K42_01370 [Candidatus Diapherotrites archaeon]|nr:hypothetical protein [Candidatus Diapherotrites archaeon]